MDAWKEHLSGKKLVGYACEVCKRRNLAFFSTHTHERSGQAFNTRHMPVMFYFNPRDKVKKKKVD